jgi:hypothetical protein
MGHTIFEKSALSLWALSLHNLRTSRWLYMRKRERYLLGGTEENHETLSQNSRPRVGKFRNSREQSLRRWSRSDSRKISSVYLLNVINKLPLAVSYHYGYCWFWMTLECKLDQSDINLVYNFEANTQRMAFKLIFTYHQGRHSRATGTAD